MARILSGIQPTGNIHIGNYLGAIKNWLALQNDHECFFGVMNLHAITLPQNPQELQENVMKSVAIYLSCGLDPKKSTIFVQSEVSQLTEIAWIFACLTPLGWLNRMTQFKEKSSQNENLGLYSYPVLMASDILSFKSDLVPVGHDQKQHLELARDIAGAFNRKVEREFFKLPEPLILKETQRIMSLQDGAKKMSKSDDSEISRINLFDDEKTIAKKIMKAKTDSDSIITYDENRPEIFNLLNIFAAFSSQKPQEIAKKYENSGYGAFKKDLAQLLVEKLGAINYNAAQFLQEKGEILKILQQGKEKAQEISQKNKREIFSLLGLS